MSVLPRYYGPNPPGCRDCGRVLMQGEGEALDGRCEECDREARDATYASGCMAAELGLLDDPSH